MSQDPQVLDSADLDEGLDFKVNWTGILDSQIASHLQMVKQIVCLTLANAYNLSLL